MGKIQGEGNYDAARKFNDGEKAFVESGRVDQAAHDAAPKSAREAEDMARAEEAGKRRSKAGRGTAQEGRLPNADDKGPQGC